MSKHSSGAITPCVQITTVWLRQRCLLDITGKYHFSLLSETLQFSSTHGGNFHPTNWTTHNNQADCTWITQSLNKTKILVKKLWDTCQIWPESRKFTVHASIVIRAMHGLLSVPFLHPPFPPDNVETFVRLMNYSWLQTPWKINIVTGGGGKPGIVSQQFWPGLYM